MSLDEWNILKNALFKARTIVSNSTTNLTVYDKWIKIHIEATVTAHHNPQFLPWHRMFLKMIEDDLHRIDNRTSGMP